MTYILINIGKCIFVGIIWAALLIPALCKRSSAMKYAITVAVVAILSYVFAYMIGGYAGIINTATLVALISLIVGWIAAGFAFSDSKVKSKVIAFTCVVAAVSYILAALVVPNVQFL